MVANAGQGWQHLIEFGPILADVARCKEFVCRFRANMVEIKRTLDESGQNLAYCEQMLAEFGQNRARFGRSRIRAVSTRVGHLGKIRPTFQSLTNIGPISSNLAQILPNVGQNMAELSQCCSFWPDVGNIDPKPTQVGHRGSRNILSTIVGKLFGNSWTTAELAMIAGVNVRDAWRATVRQLSGYTKLRNKHNHIVFVPPPRVDQIWPNSGQNWPSSR